ncbi:hypothetical protein H257_04487 [Aphanomyces astaci]|uniref:Uncharacterized protein n=1 Tax=Aphanomyces astaci TaxID=112090 RepID=W4GXZ3_APHAT|nr:hypothetical protein H257_04487 [Aphanomyces astaci]ETV83894.1 hypothetical protein H257_04487 [Aphanomyces astaci]RQM25224.1 hypothetical protein B5M09_000792 [Aphanomyces astaci]|eukprot:XP_009827324.1 hypothetical protein H257_04487 [Aphanomyces astaci]
MANNSRSGSRRPLYPELVKAFLNVIDRGDVEEVRAQLAAHPRLAIAEDEETGVTSMMKSSVAPNAIAIMTLLYQHDSRDGTDPAALLYACACGAKPAAVDLLWSWSRQSRVPEFMFWAYCDTFGDGPMVLAARSHNVVLLRHLRSIVRISDQRHPSNHSLKQLRAIISTNDEEFAVEAMSTRLIQQAIKNEEESYWRTYEDHGMIKYGWFMVANCIKDAIVADLQRVVDKFERIHPAYTHATVYYCTHSLQPQERTVWTDLRAQFVWDCSHDIIRPALLVQLRWLPGLVPLGYHIASYLMPTKTDLHKRAQSRIKGFELCENEQDCGPLCSSCYRRKSSHGMYSS